MICKHVLEKITNILYLYNEKEIEQQYILKNYKSILLHLRPEK